MPAISKARRITYCQWSFILTVITLLLLPASLPTPAAAQVSWEVVVTGQVLDSDGIPIQDLAVNISVGSFTQVVWTGASGQYASSNVSAPVGTLITVSALFQEEWMENSTTAALGQSYYFLNMTLSQPQADPASANEPTGLEPTIIMMAAVACIIGILVGVVIGSGKLKKKEKE